MCKIIHNKNEFVNHTSAQPNPTTKPRETAPANYYSILANKYDNDDDNKIEAPLNEKDIIRDYGMLDSGTTGHFIAVNANVTNIRPTNNPLNIIILDGNSMKSTHECIINWPSLPAAARTAHIIPQLKQQSLLSVVKLCDAGCTVAFENDQCTIKYNNKIVLRGFKCPRTRLWLVPLNDNTKKHQIPIKASPRRYHNINNAYVFTSQEDTIKYLHQCFFSPTKATLLKSINNNQLLGVPGLTKESVTKHLPPSSATIKGHMHRIPKNVRLTRNTNNIVKNELDEDIAPCHDTAAQCEVFCFAALANDNERTLYTDLTGKFPIRSYNGNQYIFLAYVYDLNAIIVRPMKSRETTDIQKAFKEVYSYLIERNHKPSLHIMDNECSTAVKNYATSMETTIQFVEAHIHRVNAAERAIQTFKNHFISGLCTVNKLFPLQLWCEIIKQAEMTLNMLRATRINPKLSAYAMLEGPYNFNKTPMAPPGTRALVYTDPKMRRSWETHAKDGWYVGPAPDHYRCFCFWIPSTQGFRNAQTAIFFHHIAKCLMKSNKMKQ